MIVKGIVETDVVNYKKISMFIELPYCTFKCEKDCGIKCCQNSPLAKSPNINVETADIIERYLKNPMTDAIVFGGLEPFDSFEELIAFIKDFRRVCADDIVIYTGYNKSEIRGQISRLEQYKNIVVKYGRYVPNKEPRYDDILGVKLASPNQYAERIS